MASSYQEVKVTSFVPTLTLAAEDRLEQCRETYEEHRHRIYTLAFWITGNELAAEELSVTTFREALARHPRASAEALDRVLIREAAALLPIGELTLHCGIATEVKTVRRNIKRVHLEDALLRLPVTERIIFFLSDVERYDHARIGRVLNIGQEASRQGAHQARLRMREILATLNR
jgi:RNA polymerase sigma-70 factor (ECF subfamily)